MTRKWYMVGIIVRDMAAALTFYRRLGLAIPEGSDNKTHVQVPMGDGFTFFIDARPTLWDPTFAGPPAHTAPHTYGTVLELYLKTREAVDELYAEMLNYGYTSHAAPYQTPYNMYFAMIKDPDGNCVLLSGDFEIPSPTA